MTLADRIKEAMEGAGLTPADFARATGRTAGAVSQWLGGTTKTLKSDTAAAIEKATGYRSAWLSTGKGPKKALEAETSGNVFQRLTEEEQKFLDDFRRLTDQDRARYAAEIAARAEELQAYLDQHLHPIKNGFASHKK